MQSAQNVLAAFFHAFSVWSSGHQKKRIKAKKLFMNLDTVVRYCRYLVLLNNQSLVIQDKCHESKYMFVFYFN